MKILVIGQGGREHAIIRTIKQFNKNVQIFCAPGNAGTAIDATNVQISEKNSNEIKQFVIKSKIDFVIVTPDNPLADGMVDVLQNQNVLCFGPTQKAARIESSKVFSKNLMQQNQIATAKFKTFKNSNEAAQFIKTKNEFPIVIKADGLAFGKGVFIAHNLNEAVDAVNKIMVQKQFGNSGNEIIVEEFLNGIEVSVLCLTDGKTIKPLISSMDHKKAFDNDKGPNTGGMGAVAPNPFYTPQIENECLTKIFKPTIKALEKQNCPFCGCLYFGLILTKSGPKVVEYNSRFGDPETQAILPLLKNNLLDALIATSTGNLHNLNLNFSNKHSVCVVLSSKGYPDKFETGFKIEGLNSQGQLNVPNIQIFHSGTVFKNNSFTTCSGRVLSIVSTDNCLKNAIKNAYAAINLIKFKNKFCRFDIGQVALNASIFNK